MLARTAAVVPRYAVLVLACLFTTAAIAVAADQTSNPTGTAVPAAPAAPAELSVPDVRGKAYVFAKGILEDAGFAWSVGGDVGGYAANVVSAQSPAPGTRVVDTGAPTVALTLVRTGSYRERGAPENASPYLGTEIELAAGVRTAPPAAEAPERRKQKPKPKPNRKQDRGQRRCREGQCSPSTARWRSHSTRSRSLRGRGGSTPGSALTRPRRRRT